MANEKTITIRVKYVMSSGIEAGARSHRTTFSQFERDVKRIAKSQRKTRGQGDIFKPSTARMVAQKLPEMRRVMGVAGKKVAGFNINPYLSGRGKGRGLRVSAIKEPTGIKGVQSSYNRLWKRIHKKIRDGLKQADRALVGRTTSAAQIYKRMEKVTTDRIESILKGAGDDEVKLIKERARKLKHIGDKALKKYEMVENKLGRGRFARKGTLNKSMRDFNRRFDLILKEFTNESGKVVKAGGNNVSESLEDVFDNAARQLEMVSEQGSKTAGAIGGPGLMHHMKGAVGFGSIEIGERMVQMFTGKRLQGQLAGGISEVMATVGSLFGSTVGDIAGDIGEAGANVAEIFINQITWQIRKWGLMAGGALKGFGYGIASGIFGSMAGGGGGLAAGAASLFGGSVIATSAALVGTMSLVMAMVARVQEAFDELLATIENIIKAIFATIQAGVKLWVGVIRNFLEGIKNIWQASWKSIKQITKASMQTITGTIKAGVVTSKAALQAFAQAQFRAAKAAAEIADVNANATDEMMLVMNNMRRQFGTGLESAFNTVFNAVSSGFRSIAKASKIATSSARLAMAAHSDAATASNVLVTVMLNWGKAAGSLIDVERQLAAATTLGLATLQDYGPALKNVAGYASTLGIHFSDVTAALSMLTRVMGRGSAPSAARFIARVMENLAMPTERSAKFFRELGVDLDKFGRGGGKYQFFEILKDLENLNPKKLRFFFPRIQARRGVLGLTKKMEDYAKLIREQVSVAKEYESQFRIVFGSVQTQLNRLRETASTVFEYLGKIVSVFVGKGLESIIDKIGIIISKFEKNQAIIKFFKDIRDFMRSAFDPIVPVFRRLLKYFYDLSKMDYSELRKEFGLTDDKLKSIWYRINGIVKNLMKIPTYVRGIAKVIGTVIPDLSKISEFMQKTFDVISTDKLDIVIVRLMVILYNLLHIKDTFGAIWGGLDKDKLKGLGNALLKFTLSTVKLAVSLTADIVKNAIAKMASELLNHPVLGPMLWKSFKSTAKMADILGFNPQSATKQYWGPKGEKGGEQAWRKKWLGIYRRENPEKARQIGYVGLPSMKAYEKYIPNKTLEEFAYKKWLERAGSDHPAQGVPIAKVIKGVEQALANDDRRMMVQLLNSDAFNMLSGSGYNLTEKAYKDVVDSFNELVDKLKESGKNLGDAALFNFSFVNDELAEIGNELIENLRRLDNQVRKNTEAERRRRQEQQRHMRSVTVQDQNLGYMSAGGLGFMHGWQFAGWGEPNASSYNETMPLMSPADRAGGYRTEGEIRDQYNNRARGGDEQAIRDDYNNRARGEEKSREIQEHQLFSQRLIVSEMRKMNQNLSRHNNKVRSVLSNVWP